MEKKVKRLTAYRAGAGIAYKLVLPVDWVRVMGLEEGGDILLDFDKDKQEITVKKITL